MTQTADVDACPGKCIHALASLLCGQVREDIQCPSSSMRCCVEKPRRKKKPSQSQNPLSNNVSDNPTTVKPTTVKVKKVKKTKRKSTTERTIEQTTRKQVRINIVINVIQNRVVYRDFRLYYLLILHLLHLFAGGK